MSQQIPEPSSTPPGPTWHADEIHAATALVPRNGTECEVRGLCDTGSNEVARNSTVEAGPGDTELNGATRREVVCKGAKLVFVAPLMSTFLASHAYAANYSCYPAGQVCVSASDNEPCCNGPCPGGAGICP